MKHPELGDKDWKLLAVLQRNARTPVSELARLLGVSRSTAQHRLNRLERGGVIAGYSVRLRDAVRERQVQTYVNLQVDPKRSAAVVSALEKMDTVDALFTVSGKIDLIALLRVASPADLDGVLDRIGSLPGVRGTESAIVLSTKFDRR